MWGALVNNSRNFALNYLQFCMTKRSQILSKMIPVYASILHNHLKDEETNQQLFDGVDLEIDHHKHKPNQVAKMLFQN
jgi:putative membrane protein